MSEDPSSSEIIKLLDLVPHPGEGGFYREVHRSEEKVSREGLPSRFSGDRRLCTDIYYMLMGDGISPLHKIKGEEIWHFLAGGPFTLLEIATDGAVKKTAMGQDIRAGQKLVHAVEPGVWFGCYPHEGNEYSLVSCTVAPGFEFEDFELGKRGELLRLFPHVKEEIVRLTR